MSLPKYTLSLILAGHTEDVRGVAEVDENQIITGSRDTTAKLWSTDSSNPTFYKCASTFKGHHRFIQTVAYVKPTEAFPQGIVVTGSLDATVNLWMPLMGDNPLVQLVGHDLNVCCVRIGHNNQILTSSWDKTARVWDCNGSCIHQLKGHENSVLAIVAHPTEGMYITCSADKTIRIWQGETCVNVLAGHTDVVRDMVIHGNRLISCGNDGTVRVWDLGENGKCIQTLTGHNSEYIYSVTPLIGTPFDFATGGEDGTVCIWKDGAVVQQLVMPAVSVWCVSARANGDVIVGTNDTVARVFTCDKLREAPADIVANFNDHVAQFQLAKNNSGQQQESEKIGDLDTGKDCKGPEALTIPGSKDGEILLVKDSVGKVTAHTWSAVESNWNLIGVVSDAKDNKPQTPKAEPGFVNLDVELSGMNLVCKHKIGDNPFKTAQDFIHENELNQDFLDQIANWIDQQTGHLTAPPTSTIVTAPVPTPTAAMQQFFPQTVFVSIGAAKIDALKKKLTEGNGEVGDLALDPTSLTTLFAALTCAATSTAIPDKLVESVILSCDKILSSWPESHRVPGLDCLRILLMRPEVKILVFSQVTNPNLTTLSGAPLVRFCLIHAGLTGTPSAEPVKKGVKMLSLRALCNSFDESLGLAQADGLLGEVVNGLQSLDCSGMTKPELLAAATLLLNVVVAAKRFGGSFNSSILPKVFETVFQSIEPTTDAEVQFRLIVALGTLVDSDATMCGAVLSLPQLMSLMVAACGSSSDARVSASVEKLAQILTASA